MAAQTTYGYNPQAGAAGGIVDLAPYAIDTYINEENTGDMKFGMGVVRGENANGFAYPAAGAVAADFLGVVVNRRTTEYDLDGAIYIRNKAANGIMTYGRIYARVATGVTVAPGDTLYLVISGTDKGKFTKTAAETAIAVAGRFMSAADSSGIAQIELFNAPAPASAGEAEPYTLPKASADTLGGVKIGTGLQVSADGTLSVAAE